MTGEETWLGWDLLAALPLAKPHRLLVTRPPYRCVGIGPLTVVAQRGDETGLTLVASYREFERLARD